MASGPFERERTPADHDQDDRCPGRHDRLEQLLLAADQPKVEAVAELARRRVVGQAGPLAEDEDRDSLRPRQLDGRGDAPRRSPR